MTMTGEWNGPKFDGMPKAPSLKERIAALKKDDEVMDFLRTLRVTEYHWIAEKDTGEPLTGGHLEDFDKIKDQCEWLIGATVGVPASSPIAGIRAIRILDALGALVWSKERAIREQPNETPAEAPTVG